MSDYEAKYTLYIYFVIIPVIIVSLYYLWEKTGMKLRLLVLNSASEHPQFMRTNATANSCTLIRHFHSHEKQTNVTINLSMKERKNSVYHSINPYLNIFCPTSSEREHQPILK